MAGPPLPFQQAQSTIIFDPRNASMRTLDTSRWSQEGQDAYRRVTSPTVVNPGEPRTSSYSGNVPLATGLSFRDAIAKYQAGTAFKSEGYFTGLFDYLRASGHDPILPTHAGGTQNSEDKVADRKSTELYDIASDSGWILAQDDYWVEHEGTWRGSATPHTFTDWADAGGAGESGTLIGGKGATFGTDYAAASLAAKRQRMSAGMRRGGTIIAGYGAGAPKTKAPTLIGRAA
jgi:hypothetical protein